MKVVLENLTKCFPSRNKKGAEVIAVNNFNFEIPDGKLIGLLGPSGCGNDDRKTRDERKGYQRERENPKHAVFEVGALLIHTFSTFPDKKFAMG